jgi:hypothetical protein
MIENIQSEIILITVGVGGIFHLRLETSAPPQDADPGLRGTLLPAPSPLTPRPRPFFQSLHFANRNRPNSMKINAEKNFNRYTFPQFRELFLHRFLAPSSSVDCVTLWQYTVTGSEVKKG